MKVKFPDSRMVSYGILGGVIGGILFGILMQMQGMIGMIAAMIGSESTVVGWIIHMMISIIFGISFVAVTSFIHNLWAAAVVFGIAIWVVGPLVIMPLMLGMGTMVAQAFAPEQMMSLATHLFFAFVVAVTVNLLKRNEKADEKEFTLKTS